MCDIKWIVTNLLNQDERTVYDLRYWHLCQPDSHNAIHHATDSTDTHHQRWEIHKMKQTWEWWNDKFNFPKIVIFIQSYKSVLHPRMYLVSLIYWYSWSCKRVLIIIECSCKYFFYQKPYIMPLYGSYLWCNALLLFESGWRGLLIITVS